MAIREFFVPEAKKKVARAIEAIEKETAAEVVVAVRRRCGHYRHTDFAVGAVLAFATILFVLFSPQEFATAKIPIDVAVAFALGTLLSANVAMVRRLLTSRKLMNANVRTAARAAFYDMGIARTSGRTGILVLVAIFERRVELVLDSGVKPSELGPEWAGIVAAIEASARGTSLDKFLAALGAMTPPLARALPVQPDDVDELPNEPEMS
jgi:putative membrane protein